VPLGIFSAPPFGVSGEPSALSPSWVGRLRQVLALTGAVLWLVFNVPPLSTWSTHYEFAEAIQFAAFAFVVPALLVTGAPWRGWGRGQSAAASASRAEGVAMSRLDRLAHSRSSGSYQQSAIVVAIVFATLSVVWRSAPAVDFLARHAWLSVIESVTLVAVGIALFSHLVQSPPLSPGVPRPYRIGIAAGVMWTAWVVAYLDAMSHSSWYDAYRHVAGQGVSLSADQQLSAGLIWFISAAVFVPIVFWNLIHWLQSEEDPNEELVQLIREERTRGFFGSK